MSAKEFYECAKNVTDIITKTSILYLAALSANRAQQFSSSSEMLNFNIPTIHKASALEAFDYNGRLCIIRQGLSDSKHENIHTAVSKKNISPTEQKYDNEVSELLDLESKLLSLGLMKSNDLNNSNSVLSHPIKSHSSKPTADDYSHYLSSTLGDSFLILSTYQSKVCEFTNYRYSFYI